MGANPVAMSFGELYTAMQQKVVDGQENPVSNIYKSKFYEVQKYISLTGHLHLTHMVMYSAKLWDTLPADLQKVVRDSVIESQETQRKAVRDDDETLLTELKAKGMQANEANREAFRKAMHAAAGRGGEGVRAEGQGVDRADRGHEVAISGSRAGAEAMPRARCRVSIRRSKACETSWRRPSGR